MAGCHDAVADSEVVRMAEVEERIARLQQLLASPSDDRDDDTLSRTLRNLEQLRAEMALRT